MVDMSAIAGTVAALRGATDIAKAIKEMHDTTSIQGKVIELQSKILDAQSSAFSAQEERSVLVQQVENLEKEVANLKAWDVDKERYKLSEIGQGLTAYALKPGRENGEPSHYLCANCYSRREKAILQEEIRYPGMAHVLVCHQCGSELYLHGQRHKDHSSARRR